MSSLASACGGSIRRAPHIGTPARAFSVQRTSPGEEPVFTGCSARCCRSTSSSVDRSIPRRGRRQTSPPDRYQGRQRGRARLGAGRPAGAGAARARERESDGRAAARASGERIARRDASRRGARPERGPCPRDDPAARALHQIVGQSGAGRCARAARLSEPAALVGGLWSGPGRDEDRRNIARLRSDRRRNDEAPRR